MTETLTESTSSATIRLYRWFDRDGVLLYVGVTGRPGERPAEHLGGRAMWIPFAERMVLDLSLQLTSSDEAEAAETAAIAAEEPLFNLSGSSLEVGRRAVAYLAERGADTSGMEEALTDGRRWHRTPYAPSGPSDARSAPEVVAGDLEQRIRSGEWAPGARLPGRRDLAPTVGTYVARRALELLVERGIATARFGGGTTVADPLPPPSATLAAEVAALRADVEELKRWRASHGRGE